MNNDKDSSHTCNLQNCIFEKGGILTFLSLYVADFDIKKKK